MTESDSHTDSYSLAVLFLIVLISGITVISFNAQPIILGAASEAFDLEAEQLGMLAAMEVGGIGLASLLSVAWVGRVNLRLVMTAALLVTAVGNGLCMLVESYTGLLVLRGLIGLFGEGVAFAICTALIGDYEDANRGFALSIVFQVAVGAVGLWYFPGLAKWGGFTAILAAMGLLSAVFIFTVRAIPRRLQKAAQLPDTDQDVPVQSLNIYLGLATIVFWFVGLSALWAFLERIGVDFGYTSETVGKWLALGMVTGVVSALLVSWLSKRVGQYWPPLVCILMHGLLMLLLAILQTNWIFVLFVFVFMAIWNFGLPYLLGMIADADTSGRLIVLIIVAQAGGNTLGPLVGGVVAGTGDYWLIGYASAACCLLALTCYLMFVRNLHRQT